jgi:hypothetical protein
MNRAIVLPAASCLIAFAVLLATLNGATRRLNGIEVADPGIDTTPLDFNGRQAAHLAVESAMPNATSSHSMSDDEVRVLLIRTADEYIQPWRQWETSPRHLYSRAAPRRVPTITAEITMAASSSERDNALALGTIVIKAGSLSQNAPCVVDRMTQHAWFCVDGQWLTESEWLENAPLP